MNTHVRVVAKIKPKTAIDQHYTKNLSYKNNKIILHNQTLSQYSFDEVVSPEQSQSVLYNKVALIEVQKMFQGHEYSIFVIGAHNSGKSYSLIGKQGTNKGIIPQAFAHINQIIKTQKDKQFLIQISCIGSKNNHVYDLLSPHKSEIPLKEHKNKDIWIQNYSKKTIKNIEQLQAYLDYALRKQRIILKRERQSHFAFTIHVQSKNNNEFKKGCINFIQLSDIFQNLNLKDTLLSLSCLSIYNIINSLNNLNFQSSLIPFKDCKFAYLFRQSFGGGINSTFLLTLDQSQHIINLKRYLQLAKKTMTIQNKCQIQNQHQKFQLQNMLSKIKQLSQFQVDQFQSKSREGYEKQKQIIYRNQFISSNHLNHIQQHESRKHPKNSMGLKYHIKYNK